MRSARRVARPARRRPARPHVLHGGAEPRLPRRSCSIPATRQPRRQRRGPPSSRADYLDPPALAALRATVRGGDDRVRERAGGGAGIPRARVARDAAARRASRSRRTASARRRSSPAAASPSRRSPCCATPPTRAAVDDALLPGILKTARLGYDGKGQVRVRTRDDVVAAFDAMGRRAVRARAA